MNDLKPGTRSLLATARGAESLSQHDRARIKQRVLMQVAVLGTSAVASGGAAAMSLAAKLTLVVSSIAVLGGGAAAVWVWQRPAPEPIEAARRPTPAKLARVEPAATPAAQAPAPTSAPPAPARRDSAKNQARRPAPVAEPAAEATTTVAPLDPELRVLRQAQDDLRAGLPAQALRRLQDFERHFGAGSLGQERQAIAAIAFCQAQPGPASRARAEAFLRNAPESPLAARVRAACDETALHGKPINKNDRAREP